ncbi:MAG: hypothetical protein QW282_06320 [Nitrososphaerales archaeon]
MIYRSGRFGLWRRLKKLEAIELESSEKSMIYQLAKKLAEISKLLPHKTYQRITPKSEEELAAAKTLYEKVKDKSVEELSEPTIFCETFLNWRPLTYQLNLLTDRSRQIAVRWGRQMGKTTTFAAKAIHYCITRAGSQALITAPGLRQSMIVSDKIEDHINNMNPVARRAWIRKIQRQTITFYNGSRVKALPYSLHRLRGETCDLIFCLPHNTRIAMANGEQKPIQDVNPGELVLSYNFKLGKVEAKRVLAVYRNPPRPLVRICHERGVLHCTYDHKIYTQEGFTRAISLSIGDRLLFIPRLNDSQDAHQALDSAARTVPLRRAFRRFKPLKDKGKQEKQLPANTALLETSRVCSVQILDYERFCANSSPKSGEQGLGERIGQIPNHLTSSLHNGEKIMLSEWGEVYNRRMAFEDKPSFGLGGLVYGRWVDEQKERSSDQYTRLSLRRESDASSMAEEYLGYSGQGETGQAGQGILSDLRQRKQRQVLRHHKTIRDTEYAAQASCTDRAYEMLDMWRNLSAKETSPQVPSGGGKEGNMPQAQLQKGESSAKPTDSECKEIRIQDLRRYNNELCLLRQAVHTQRWTANNMQHLLPQTELFDEETAAKQKVEDEAVYNLNVEGNHNYFAEGVLVSNCDEAAFIRDDEILFDNILKPMLATRWSRGAQLIASSTPWGRNTMFYRFCKDPIISKDWSQHHVTWRAAVEEGLIPQEFIDTQRKSISAERFMREYEAEFVEDADSYLPQDLIARCQDPELEYWGFEYFVRGRELYAGLDLGKKQDYSVLAVVEKFEDTLKLRHIKRFDLETSYASVIGYVKIISERWQTTYRVCVDQSGVGEYIVEDMNYAGIPNVEGVVLTMPRKEEVLGYLKQTMLESKLKLPYDQELIAEMNIEKYELTKDGHIRFSHPEGTHDDRLWALALAVYASRSASKGVIQPL